MGLGVARALALGNSRVYMGLQGYARDSSSSCPFPPVLFPLRKIGPQCRGITGRSGWGLVLSLIWPVILMFSVKICKILMFSVLKKLTVKCLKVLEQ